MRDLETYEQELKNSPNAEKIISAARSAEGQQVAKMLNSEAVEKAAREGDAAALKNILGQVLSTPEGMALAMKLRKAIDGK